MSARDATLVLVLNAGSSSLKFAAFNDSRALTRIFTGAIDRIGSSKASFTLTKIDSQETERAEIPATDHIAGLEHLLKRLSRTTSKASFNAIGHRVVHGGPRYEKPQRVDNAMLTELRRIRPFDPEHLPAEIALMECLAAKLPGTPQIACFDTAFHQNDLPRVAQLLPIPRRYAAKGVRRYGFHGLSYAYLMEQPGTHGRVILAHLGNGASLAAVRDGKPVRYQTWRSPQTGRLPHEYTFGRSRSRPRLVSGAHRANEREGVSQNGQPWESGLLGISKTSSGHARFAGTRSER